MGDLVTVLCLPVVTVLSQAFPLNYSRKQDSFHVGIAHSTGLYECLAGVDPVRITQSQVCLQH